jgi:hypothetical protein
MNKSLEDALWKGFYTELKPHLNEYVADNVFDQDLLGN